MNRKLLSLFLLAALCRGSVAWAADGWAQLKAGMSLEKAVAAVGAPLIKSRGRGYDLWIYDGGAEVIAHQGTVVGWTVPTAVRTAAPSRPQPLVLQAPVLALPLKAAVAQVEVGLRVAKAAVPQKNT